MGKRLSFQQRTKRIERECLFCGESDYALLDVHRIVPGAQGGKYRKYNSVCTCANCHRKCGSGEIVIDRYYNSTKGRVLHYFQEGKEYWR